jgi:signal transduction histidine kinase
MPKHRIFIKIYLWFWFATITIGFSMMTIDRLTHNGPGSIHFKQSLGYSISMYGKIGAEIFERKGPEALKRFLNHVNESANIHIYIMGSNLLELTGQKPPQKIEKTVALTKRTGQPEINFSGEKDYIANIIRSENGKIYYVAGALQKPPHGGGGGPFSGLLRFLVVLLLSGGVCYYLAIYFTNPIIKLRNAARQFADGNLKIRVGKSIVHRDDEISELAKDFDHMADRIESLLISQKNLLRDISHELRSPLARLNLALELSRKKSSSEAGESLDRIEKEAVKLNELIGLILVLNRFESESALKEKITVDLSDLIIEITDDADFEAKSRNSLVKIIENETCVISGNREYLHRAIENIVRNAVLYTGENSSVEVSLSKIIKNGADFALIKIRDYGTGVPEEEISHIFEPFYRVGDDRDRQSGGVGVGLAITEAAVKLHGGTVKASNADGGGLLVELSLPLG